MDNKEPKKSTRREVLVKAGKRAAFIAPVLMSINLGEAKAGLSSLPPLPPPPWSK